MSVIHDPELARLLAALHAESDDQAAAMKIHDIQRSKAAYPPTEDEVKAFRPQAGRARS